MRTTKDTDTLKLHRCIELAIDRLVEAETQISYYSFPEVNKTIKGKLDVAIGLLYDVLDVDIFKIEKY